MEEFGWRRRGARVVRSSNKLKEKNWSIRDEMVRRQSQGNSLAVAVLMPTKRSESDQQIRSSPGKYQVHWDK